jgi:hypothetical protein
MAKLYDLEKDPAERANLIAAAAAAPTVEELTAELNRLMAATGLTTQTDRMPLDLGIKKELPDQKIR